MTKPTWSAPNNKRVLGVLSKLHDLTLRMNRLLLAQRIQQEQAALEALTREED